LIDTQHPTGSQKAIAHGLDIGASLCEYIRPLPPTTNKVGIPVEEVADSGAEIITPPILNQLPGTLPWL
jgi:hypothetical protein